MAFTWHRQPLKLLYIIGTIGAVLFIRLPFWLVLYSLPSARPRHSWSISRSLVVQLFRSYTNAIWTIDPPAHVVSDPTNSATADADGSVAVDPAPRFVTDAIQRMADANGVQAARTAGFWIGPRSADGNAGQKAGPIEKVVYHFHSKDPFGLRSYALAHDLDCFNHYR
jgi:hypothetical protein